MKANERIQKIIDNEGLNAKLFSEKLGFERPQVIYDILKNKTKTITENLAVKIISVFPQYSKYWLLTGEGDMLQSSSPPPMQTNIGDGVAVNNSQFHDINSTAALQKLADEIAEQRKMYAALLEKRDEELARKDGQIAKLLELLAAK